jgi:ABC transport system ATP-binding/permease protein
MSRGPILAQLKSVRLSLGGAPLFENADIALAKGDRAALVGANGVGKSTLMRILSGETEADSGDRTLTSGARLAVVPQEPDLDGYATLLDYARAPFGAGEPHADHEATAALQELGLDPTRSPTTLSGGEARRASLARAFAADPDILLLDEPTNHLDIPAIEGLEEKLNAFRGAILMVSHDRRFLERASTCCLWLRLGKLMRLDRGFGAFEEWASAVEAQEEKILSKVETQLKAEERWLQRGVTARRARNEGRRRKLMAMRAERQRRKNALSGSTVALEAEKGAESGRVVIEAKNLSKAWDTPAGPRTVVKDLSIRIMRGDRIGIVGPNGAGKSTLIEMLLLNLAPDAGMVRHGALIESAYVNQGRANVKTTDTVWEALTPLGGDHIMVRGHSRHVASYAKDFLFTPAQLRQPVSSLSGGERNRLALAVALARPANLLVLDEPTNDLDMDTLDALEDALAAYDGTILIVSHDRAFLDGVTTQILGSRGDGQWVETPGGYADFEREYGPYRAQAAPKRMQAAPSAPPPERRAPAKLSFKDEHRAKEIEALLPKLETEIAALEGRLADQDFFAKDSKGYQAAAQRHAAAKAEHDRAETEWLEIEERRAALSAGR